MKNADHADGLILQPVNYAVLTDAIGAVMGKNILARVAQARVVAQRFEGGDELVAIGKRLDIAPSFERVLNDVPKVVLRFQCELKSVTAFIRP